MAAKNDNNSGNKLNELIKWYTNSATTKKSDPKILFYSCAAITALTILFITGYIFYEAFPIFMKEGLTYLISSEWDYETNKYGILTYIVGTVIVTFMTMMIAAPMGLLTAIFLSEFSPVWLKRIMRPMIELLIGIPSVIYGIFGLYVLGKFFEFHIDPLIDSTLGFIPIFKDIGPSGSSVLLASVVLSIMVLPTMTVISEETIRSIPRELRDGSIALGATRWETVKKLLIPLSMTGITTAFILSMMRAMGETMAIVMLTGSVQKIPTSILDMGEVMTTKLVTDIGYYLAFTEPRSALFGIAAVLFIMEFMLIAVIKAISRR